MVNPKLHLPSWKFSNTSRQEASVNPITEKILQQHHIELIYKGSDGFEQNLTDLAWFLADPFRQYDTWDKAEQVVGGIRETQKIKFDSLRQVAVLLRYDGKKQAVKIRNQVDQDLLENLVDGALLSRPTGAFTNDFLAECLDRRKTQEPSQVYSELIERENPSLFKIKYYGEHIYDADIPATAGFLIYMQVLGNLQTLGLSQPLIKGMLTYYRSKGLDYAFAFASLTGMHYAFLDEDEATIHLQEYVLRKDERNGRGLHPDASVRSHQKAGAQIIAGLPDCRYDPRSFNNGVFVIYDLKELERTGRLK